MADHQLGEWRHALAGLEPLELPSDRRPSDDGPGLADRVPFDVLARTADALAALARDRGVELPAVLLTVFHTLLARHAGRGDVPVAVPADGTRDTDAATVVRGAAGDPAFTEALAHVARGMADAVGRGPVPLAVLADAAGGAVAWFAWRTAGREAAAFPPDAHVTLEVVADGGGLSGVLGYRTDLFERATAERMAGHLATLACSAADAPGEPLSALEMLTEPERHRILTEWNGPRSAFPDTATVHRLVGERAALQPDAVALEHGGQRLTYRELDERAEGLARYLAEQGVGPGALVAVCLDHGPDLVCALLGVLKSGAAYVPLDPAYPAERLRYMVEDSAAPVVVTQSAHAGLFAPGTALLLADREWPAGTGTVPVAAAGPDDVAYVIYTSGSTGRPKGVRVGHRGVVNYLHWCDRNYPPAPGARIGSLLCSSAAFDLTVTALFLPLVQGLCLVVPQPEPGRGVFDAAVDIVATGVPISFLKATPSHLELLTARLEQDGVRHGIATVVAGGEDLTPALAHRALALGTGDTAIVNEYGPTEATVGNVVSRTVSVDPAADHVPMGRAIDNTEVYVVGAHGEVQPVGVPGELLIGGVNVALGYLGRHDLTARRFVPHPFSADPEARVYRTGDLVKWLPDGRLVYLGRMDDQVKLRGHRVELGEIENALLSRPAVAAATVVVREDVPGDKRLVAYLVPTGGTAVAVAGLRAALARELPEHMLPARYVVLERLPLTPNGKVDRRALPAPEGHRPDVSAAFAAPRTPTQRAVVGIWAELLGVDEVGADDDFFELGGHSLLAVRIASRLRRDLGVDVPYRTLFDAPTPALLATAVDALDPGTCAAIPRADRSAGALPLSFAQQRLWFLDQLAPGRAEYAIPVGLRVEGDFAPDAFGAALTALAASHEILRTRFVADATGRPFQVVDAVREVAVDVHDARQLGAGAAREMLREAAGRPFDLAAGPLLRAVAVRVADTEWLLLLTVHHIVSDGWSEGILARELGELYGAAVAGRPCTLAPLGLQYADFASWQREVLDGPALAGQSAYWRERLAGVRPLELPTDHRRPAERSGRGGTVSFSVPADVAGAARRLAAGQGASLFMSLLAVFQLLMAKYSGQDDIAVGSPAAGRNRAETEDLIGFFVNTLVLRTDLSGDPAFTELLDRVKDTALGAYDHQDLPFERLVEELAPDRDLSRNPLFQTMFVLQNTPDGHAWQLPGAVVEPFAVREEEAKFDLTLILTERPDGSLDGDLVFALDLFAPDTAERLAGHFTTLLCAAVAGPERPLSELEVLTGAERRRVLAEWSGTASAADTGAEAGAGATVHRLVEECAALRPDTTAVLSTDGELTYRELNARANRLARHLRFCGAGPGAAVAVCLERGPEQITALLAVLKSGAAYLPLDPEHPTDRLAYMVADARAALVVTDSARAARLPDEPGRFLTDRDWPSLADLPAHDPEPAASSGDLAYVIYTSGSTGRPKGVEIEHRSLVGLVRWTADTFGAAPGRRVALLAGVGFDAAAWELWPALATGATVCVPDDTVRLTPALLQRWLSERRVTGTFVSTPMLESLAALDWSEPTSLEYVLTGGDALRLPAGLRLPFRVVNNYGPTESTVVTTSAEVVTGTAVPPIGRPVRGTFVYVVDRYGRPVPTGVPGELLVGGAGLARGYRGQPGQTAERFVTADVDGTPRRVYRTGDRVRWLADGQLEFLGRLDDQVKLRGHRIEPGEIEAVLLVGPDVAAATVVVREDAPGDKRLVAYVVPAAGATVRGEVLRGRLRRELPDFMVPSAFVALERLPLTPNGKVDRRELPAPEPRASGAGGPAPRTPVERAIAAAWSQVLGTEVTGVDDNFFELGGHSLLATQVTSRLRDALGVEVPVRELFAAPTVVGLAAAVAELAADGTAGAERIVSADRTGGPLPLSFAQQRLWFLDQLEPGRAEYAVPFALRVSGALDTDALDAALTRMLARHEILRTRFVADDDGEPAQVVDPPAPVHTAVHDLRHIADTEERQEAARHLARAEAARPFDLAAGPLLRAHLVRLADEEAHLLLTVHHIACDGWSEPVMARELREGYRAATTGISPEDTELPVQYADFSVWQRQQLTGDVLEGQLAYWRERLAGVEPLELPTDHRRPEGRPGGGDTVTFEVSAAVAAGLRKAARNGTASLYMVLLAAFQVLLVKYARQDDVTVGSPVAGRNRAETEDLIGFFVNTLVLRTDLSGDPAFTELLDRVKDTALGAYDHQDLPFERIVEELAPDRDPSRNPLFQTMFVFQNTPDEHGWSLPGLDVEPFTVTLPDAKFDLTLMMSEDAGGGLRGALEYRTDLFERDTVARLAGHLGTLLETVAREPAARLSRLCLLTAEEGRRTVVEWNDTAAAFPDTATLHGLFEERAAQQPDTVAVEGPQGTLTYGELNALANRIAHHLRTRYGVRPDMPVAVCLERGPDLVAAVLGVLKAGAPYVPLDPDHPAERLACMVRDTATPVVLTGSAHTGRLPSDVPLLLLDEDTATLADEPDTDPRPAAAPHHLAYLIYTSGSTGRPKGVQVEHRSLVNLVHWTAREYGLEPGQRIALLAGIGFDAAAWELWLGLTRGATCCVTTETVRLTPHLLRDWLCEQRVHATFLSTPMLEALVALPWAADSPLDYVLTGGDRLRMPPQARLPFRVVNNYGPTETTVLATSTVVEPGDAVPPIGRPIPNALVFVVDQHGRPVPVGVPGELLIGGVPVARGYRGRPELTEERFTAYEAEGVSTRVYRTGDLVRWRADGQLEFLRRIDNQVKIRGNRIELGEVESTLLTHPGIGEVSVIVREDTPGDKRLVAYLVTTGADAPSTADLHAHLGRFLPDYMIPAAFVTLERLPLTANGKVDRAALPVPDHQRPDLGREYTAPRNAVERTVTAVWQELLGIDRVGVHDNFFQLGGHSLLATQVASRLRKALRVDVPVRAVFDSPTPAQLAQAIADLMMAAITAQFAPAR
ncbi:amino acid adenylation domain-containing protein [Streptomyces sp. NBC_01591]|uniref:non-ribosomal peptide synthetase n=1 Tax=Streptomyces sp. NBC_01591 TaxID=2975888 RepID=UPI002DDAFC73|nr:non-ribosomal peptide synthetase [Streptomyces sp. NBC_01591]WSD66419.1 amino acid adenylation domain-containing protein [Streptomyces sp. NBC_01591]